MVPVTNTPSHRLPQNAITLDQQRRGDQDDYHWIINNRLCLKVKQEHDSFQQAVDREMLGPTNIIINALMVCMKLPVYYE